MIRFIDLRHHHEDMGNRFAFWDTITDQFVEDSMGDQAWETIGAFAQWYKPTETQPLERFVGLTPEWAKHAPPDREVFKVEVVATGGLGGSFLDAPLPGALRHPTHAHARNEDGSAACHIPLSPVVLQAMQGRKVAYFYGEQTYGFDESVGAIEGQIVINFDDEDSEQSW